MALPPQNTPPTRPKAPYVTALLWGDAGMVAGAAVVLLLALPFYPRNDDGWAALGWLLLVVAAGAVAGLVAGTTALWRGLRRSGAAHPRATALTFVPVAVLLGAFTAGVGVLAAPPLAHWLVEGFARRSAARPGVGSPAGTVGTAAAPSTAGYGPDGYRAPASAAERPRRNGTPQRVLIALVLSALATVVTLDKAGSTLGGELYGELMVWALCLPVLIVLPLLLLGRRLPVAVLAGGIAVLAGLAALAVPGAVENAHPSPARLERLASDLPVPPGQQVQERAAWRADNDITDTPLPVQVLLSGPTGSASSIPLALRGPSESPGQRLAATARGQQAADAWELVLQAEGWEVDEYSGAAYPGSSGSSWLPDAAQSVVDAPRRVRYERGPWVRASVVPYGDGALVVVTTRP